MAKRKSMFGDKEKGLLQDYELLANAKLMVWALAVHRTDIEDDGEEVTLTIDETEFTNYLDDRLETVMDALIRGHEEARRC